MGFSSLHYQQHKKGGKENKMKIKIICEVLRYEKGLSVNQRWLENILKNLLDSSLNASIEYLNNEELLHLHNSILNCYGLNKPSNLNWVKLYTKEPTQEVLDIIQKYFTDSFIIAFELHPLLEKAFKILNIPYLKLMWHPIRYMDDIFFGMTSNIPSIHDKLLKYQTNDFIFKQKAGLLKAEASVNEFYKKINIQENSCVFFAQTNVDCSLIDGNKMLNFFDFKDEFLKDIENYDHVYFKIHPCERNGKVIDFIKSIDKATILYPNDINFYDLISSDKIKKCFAISSGSLYEARLFGKETKYYYKLCFFSK